MFVSCKNDLAEVDALMAAKTQPATVIDTFALVRVDSGKVVMRMRAAQVVMEPNPKDASLTDRKASGGVEIEMYDPATGEMSARLTSHRAIEHASSGLSEALGTFWWSISRGIPSRPNGWYGIVANISSIPTFLPGSSAKAM